MRTTAFVCIHGIGIHDSGGFAAQVHQCLTTAAQELGGTVTEVTGNTPQTALHRAEVRLPDQDPFIAEFYDGWWDRRTPRPSFWTVLLWLLQIAPLALLNTGVLWCADRLAELRGRSLRTLLTALLPAGVFIAVAPLAVVVLPLVLLVAAAVPAWRGHLQSIIVDIVGDAWLYRSKELDTDVIPHLMQLTLRAASHADRVVMVGHSQGAELSRRVGLRLERDRTPGAEVRRFVWAGSGENQLNMVRALARNPFLLLVFWPYLLAWPPVIHLLGTVITERTAAAVSVWSSGAGLGAGVQHGLWVLGAVALGVAFIAVGVAAIRVLVRPPRDAGNIPRGMSWYVQSVLDPVSFGSAGVRDRVGGSQSAMVRYVPVDRSRPWWFEHISYFAKQRTGEVLLEAALERPHPLRPPHRPVVPLWVLVASAAGIVVAIWASFLIGGWVLGLLW